MDPNTIPPSNNPQNPANRPPFAPYGPPPPYQQPPYPQPPYPPMYPPPYGFAAPPTRKLNQPGMAPWLIVLIAVGAVLVMIGLVVGGISVLSALRATTRPDGYLGTNSDTVLYLQFADDGSSSHTLAGTINIDSESNAGMQTQQYTVSGSRDGNNVTIVMHGPFGIEVSFTGTFDSLEQTLTIHVADSNGCIESGTLVGASIQQYNAAVDQLRTSWANGAAGGTSVPTGGTCQQ